MSTLNDIWTICVLWWPRRTPDIVNSKKGLNKFTNESLNYHDLRVKGILFVLLMVLRSTSGKIISLAFDSDARKIDWITNFLGSMGHLFYPTNCLLGPRVPCDEHTAAVSKNVSGMRSFRLMIVNFINRVRSPFQLTCIDARAWWILEVVRDFQRRTSLQRQSWFLCYFYHKQLWLPRAL